MEQNPRSARRRRAEGPGWLATALGAALLVAVGFATGVVIGAAFQEPELVADHLAGRTEEVPLAAVNEGAPVEEALEEIEPLPLGAAPIESAPGPSAAGAPVATAPPPPPARPTGKPPAAPAGTGGFLVQVGAFSDERAAAGLARELRTAGFAASVTREQGGRAPFKVRVGPAATREQAERLASRLKRERSLPTWVQAQGTP